MYDLNRSKRKAFKSNANRALSDSTGYVVNKCENVWGSGVMMGQDQGVPVWWGGLGLVPV